MSLQRILCGLAVMLASISTKALAAEDCEILKWCGGKKAAVTITFDGGTINQFRVAVPIMNEMKLPGVFFIVTGDIKGSKYTAKFIGRSLEEILKETATIPISETNFFERAAAIRFLGCEELLPYHTRAGDLFETGKRVEAMKEIDQAWAKARSGELKISTNNSFPANPTVDASWDDIRKIAAQGHEFGSHSMSHPQPAIVDDANLRYEVEQSKTEILEQLGPRHTFSAELPHGGANPRVLEVSFAAYPALRNAMPEPFLEEINRWNKTAPGNAGKEYVQWQRGPKTKTTVAEMNGWVDTCLAHDNFWLVLTFHGIDGIGYEPKTAQDIREFFSHIDSNREDLWIATFQDVVKYMRERMASKISVNRAGDKITVDLTHSLDAKLYNLPLTLRVPVPDTWNLARITQNQATEKKMVTRESAKSFVIVDVVPNRGPIVIEKQ